MSERQTTPHRRRGPGGGGPGGMQMGGGKAKNFKKTIGQLLQYLGPQKFSILLVLIFAVVGTIFTIVGPKILGRAIDDLAIGVTKQSAYKTVRNSNLGSMPMADITLPDGRVISGKDFSAAIPADIKGVPFIDLVSRDKPVTMETLMFEIMANPRIQAGFSQAIGELIRTGKMTEADVPALQQGLSGGSTEFDSLLTQLSPAYKEALLALDFNGEKPEIDFDSIAKTLLLLIGLYAISMAFSFIQYMIMAGVTQKTVFQLRDEVSQKLNRLPMKYFDDNPIGDILSRVTNDVDNIANTLQQSLIQIISSATTIVGILVMMLTISWKLTLVAVVTVPVSLLIAAVIASLSQKQFARNQEELGNLTGQVEEMYAGQRVVAAYGNEQRVIEQFSVTNERLYAAGWKSQFITGIIMPSLNFVGNLGYVFVCIVGGVLSGRGEITLGAIQSFIQYSRQFSQPIIQTANIANVLQSTAASAERVFELLAETEEVPDSPEAVSVAEVRGDIAFREVKFGYADDTVLMQNINIDVHAGQTVAIVGPTGAGKTTMVNLLMRFYELHGGAITVDGKNITAMTRGDLRSLLGMVLQDTWLFGGTIAENIAYGREGATLDEVVAAADAAYVDHFVRTLPDGYDTVLNEEATNISGGQKQLITIARALLADPQVMILDEATSSVDTRTEVLIQKAMGKLMQGRTSFVIAHRLSTIKNADLILVMNHGDIIEQGTHQQLMDQNGFYAEMYNSQFAGKAG